MSSLYTAWQLMLSAGSMLSHSDAYQFDLVDLTRQALVNTGDVCFFKLGILLIGATFEINWKAMQNNIEPKSNLVEVMELTLL